MRIKEKHLDFLKEIAQNNNREWFKEHKPEFDVLYAEVRHFFEEIDHQMRVSDQLEPMHMHRIYRNLQFSKDKTPYKTHFRLYLGRTQPFYRGGYYLHLQPGQSFAGGGFWRPEAADLLLIRKAIAKHPDEILKILHQKTLKSYFGTLQGEELKTMPRGFDKNNPAALILKKKQFLLKRDFSDAEVLSEQFMSEVLATFQAVRPFFDYMTEVLTTDENGVSLYEY